MGIRPVLQALVLADHVYIDANTGKKVIAGTFNHLTAQEFPTTFGRNKFAFISLTDVHGKVPVSLRYVDLSTNEPLFEMKDLEVESSDPLETVEMVVEVPSLPMPHEGAFAFEIHAAGEIVGSLRIFVSRIQPN